LQHGLGHRKTDLASRFLLGRTSDRKTRLRVALSAVFWVRLSSARRKATWLRAVRRLPQFLRTNDCARSFSWSARRERKVLAPAAAVCSTTLPCPTTRTACAGLLEELGDEVRTFCRSSRRTPPVPPQVPLSPKEIGLGEFRMCVPRGRIDRVGSSEGKVVVPVLHVGLGEDVHPAELARLAGAVVRSEHHLGRAMSVPEQRKAGSPVREAQPPPCGWRQQRREGRMQSVGSWSFPCVSAAGERSSAVPVFASARQRTSGRLLACLS
jgi:hypothetical protein